MTSALERYLADCESKRRRRRDRPSDEVLGELRQLLTRLGYAPPESDPEAPDAASASADDSLSRWYGAEGLHQQP